jgi:undecaprenyl diphosphate synthase
MHAQASGERRVGGPNEDELTLAKRTGLRCPRHVGFIPDGNRRWATTHGLAKESGYAHGLDPGLRLFDACRQLKIDEVSVYGFTRENTRRPAAQSAKFRAACVEFALEIERRGAALMVLGDDSSAQFPPELLRFRRRQGDGLKVNLLVNYNWQWDVDGMRSGQDLRSSDVSRVDMIVRWGGARRLSGFLPIQSAYADLYVVDDYWPDFQLSQFITALQWFGRQERTLGG